MSDSPASSFSAVSVQRKLVAVVAAVLLVVSMGLAFVLGGKKVPVAKDTESDTQIGTLTNLASVDLNIQATPDEWFEGVPNGFEAPAQPAAETPKAGSKLSSVVTGDNPAANPSPDASPAGAAVPNTIPANNVTRNSTSSVTPNPQAPTSVSQDGRPASNPSAGPLPGMIAATNGGAAVDGIGERVPSSNQPASRSAPASPVPTTTVIASTTPTDSTSGPATTSSLTASASQVAGAPGTQVMAKSPLGADAKNPSPRAPSAPSSGAPLSPAGAAPVFVRPAQKRFGIIAQTRSLITEKQFPAPLKNTDGNAPSSPVPPASANSTAGVSPARVRHQEARAYAKQTTDKLRQQGTLKPTERVRLPRSVEVANPAIWHEDDVPASTDERRPFGLVLTDENPGFTPEGIPLRTDLPAGASPLEKTGADKPLWKRPE